MNNNEEKEVIIENVKYSLDKDNRFIVEEKIGEDFKRITPPENLYRICSFNDNTIDSIVDNYLWASERYTLNDPLEFENPIFGDYSEEFLEKFYNKIKGIKNEDKRRDKEHIKLNSDNIKIIIKQYQRIYDKQIGITSFYELPTDKEADKEFLMWSHYGNGHTGLRIKYNTNILKFCRSENGQFFSYLNRITYLNFSEYSDSSNKIPVKNINPRLINYINIFVKNNIWNYENEWRLLSRSDDNLNVEDREIRHYYPSNKLIEEITFGRYFFKRFSKNLILDENKTKIIFDFKNYKEECNLRSQNVEKLFKCIVDKNISTDLISAFKNEKNVAPLIIPIKITNGNNPYTFFIELKQDLKKVYTNQRLSSQKLIDILLNNFKNPNTLLM